MAHEVTLNSFADLAHFFETGEASDQANEYVGPVATIERQFEDVDPSASLRDILGELERANATLSTIARRDEEARNQALSDLERYDGLMDQLQRAETALTRARELLDRAQAVVDEAFHEEAREAANHVVTIAQTSEQRAAELVMAIREQVDALARDVDIDRLLKLRRRIEEQEQAKAAQSERAERLSVSLKRACAALDLGRIEEARALLGPFLTEDPVDADVASLLDRIAQAELEIKAEQAEDALWEARRSYHRDAASALARLEGLDVEGLPQELGGQLFGQWARTAARVCRERDIQEPLRYTPALGRGAVLVRHESGAYQVVSAIGMGARWSAGALVGERYGRWSRPLR
ncbi:MAG TPA: hypothetical protein VK009_18985 [Chloroflexota bacterium]|nr:hypothetical protein [Chloroflexota bacterium]